MAKAARAAEPARKVLQRVGIGIHSAANGGAVKIAKHQGLHTPSYYEQVNTMLANAERGGRQAVEDTLSNIRNMIGGR